MPEDIREVYRAMRWRAELRRAQMRTVIISTVAIAISVTAWVMAIMR
jgi:hypothetical protein